MSVLTNILHALAHHASAPDVRRGPSSLSGASTAASSGDASTLRSLTVRPRLAITSATAVAWIIAIGMILASCPRAQADGASTHNLRPHSPAMRLGVCRQHGPRGGCVHWSHRRIHHAPWPLH